MKLSIFYDHILNASRQTGKTISEVLNAVREHGIEAVELDLFNFEDTENHLALLEEAGIKTACVNGFYSMEKEFDASRMQSHIQAAVQSGTDKILIVPGFLSREDGEKLAAVIHSRADTREFLESCPDAIRICDGLSKAVEMASEYGITVTVEDFDNTASPLSGLNSLLWYQEKIPGLMCTFDTGNFITHNDDLFESYELLKSRIVHVHCKDRGDGPVAIGEGRLPCSRLLRQMAADGYNGFVAIEHYGAVDQLSCIKASANYLRKELF